MADVIRRLLIRNEVEVARRWQAAACTELAELQRFEKHLAASPGAGRVILGRACASGDRLFWVGQPAEAFLSLHAWTTGSTGSGKTYLVLAVLLQLLREGN